MSTPHQYFIQANVAEQCVLRFIEKVGQDDCKRLQVIITPSCGNSNFLNPLQQDERFTSVRVIPVDVAPNLEHGEMTLLDCLDLKLDYDPSPRAVTAVIGNPPFGTAGEIAAQFLESAVQIADYVALVLPESFCEQTRQIPIAPDLRLVWREDLPRDVFELPDGTLYRTGACFQIWQREVERA